MILSYIEISMVVVLKYIKDVMILNCISVGIIVLILDISGLVVIQRYIRGVKVVIPWYIAL